LLTVIPTPIGNLGDITARAIEQIGAQDFIYCEDTRVTVRLLKHLEISVPLRSYHVHSEHRLTDSIIELLQQGHKIGLMSDAGAPAISDPGFLLVRACIEHDIEVQCLPGPAALIPALVVSGMPTDRFCFEGFLPSKKGRMKRLEALETETRTMVFYESPHRIIKAIEQFISVFGEDRKASISREISKLYEETVRGTLSELLSHFQIKKPKGEFVMVIAGKHD
jgi:16S rRNA (cytidine1402-2'-O)-methyltransferase